MCCLGFNTFCYKLSDSMNLILTSLALKMELIKATAYKSEDQAGEMMGKGFDPILRTHKVEREN